MKCTQCGHESNGRFCPECGATMPLPVQQEPEIPPERFVVPAAPTAASGAARAPASPAPAQPKSRSLRWVIVAVAAVVLAVAIGIAVQQNRGKVADAAPDDPVVTEPSESPHDICVNQLTTIVINLVNGKYDAEIKVNGQNDPFYQAATGMTSTAQNDRYQVGDTKAMDNLYDAAGPVCSRTLNDAIRPNYPTDGTSP